MGSWGRGWGCAWQLPRHKHPHGESPPLDQQPASPRHRPDPHAADSPVRASDRLEAPGSSGKSQDPLGCWRNATESREHPTEGTDPSTPSRWICAGGKVFGASRALRTGEDREVKWAEPGSSSIATTDGRAGEVQIHKIKRKKKKKRGFGPASPLFTAVALLPWAEQHGWHPTLAPKGGAPGSSSEPTRGPTLGLAQAAPTDLRVPAACQGHSVTAGTTRAALTPQAPRKSAFR